MARTLIARTREGKRLSDSLEVLGPRAPRYLASMIRSGEESGALGASIGRAAELLDTISVRGLAL